MKRVFRHPLLIEPLFSESQVPSRVTTAREVCNPLRLLCTTENNETCFTTDCLSSLPQCFTVFSNLHLSSSDRQLSGLSRLRHSKTNISDLKQTLLMTVNFLERSQCYLYMCVCVCVCVRLTFYISEGTD